MLTLWGKNRSFCDGLSRRDFLRVGALGFGGLTLPDLYRLRAQEPARAQREQKAIIMIGLPGGPSQFEMYDLKPDAPDGIRGEFKPIQTKVPGLEISELFPLQAQIADQLAIVRGVARAHGGKVWVESSGHDEANHPGSTFYLQLPVDPPAPDSAPRR